MVSQFAVIYKTLTGHFGFSGYPASSSRFAFLRCLVSLPFRPDGIDILDILVSGVPADFRQPSRSAFQPQVRSTSSITSLSPVEALR